MFCEEWSLVKIETPTLRAIPLRCRCWTCEHCAGARARQLIHEAAAGRPRILITLTSRRRPGECPHAAAQALAAAWRVIRRRYITKHGKGSLPFMAVFEATKKGWPHLHIVARARWLDQRWLSDCMNKLTGSPIVDVRRIYDVGDIAKYVSKYIGKDPHHFQGVKRYWRSLDYLHTMTLKELWEEGGVNNWLVVRSHWTTITEILQDQGFDFAWAFCHDLSFARKPP